jgi:hypothetical protein
MYKHIQGRTSFWCLNLNGIFLTSKLKPREFRTSGFFLGGVVILSLWIHVVLYSGEFLTKTTAAPSQEVDLKWKLNIFDLYIQWMINAIFKAFSWLLSFFFNLLFRLLFPAPLDYLLWRSSGRFCQEFVWVENSMDPKWKEQCHL